MKTLSSSLAALAVVAGGAGATLAYQTASDAGPAPVSDQRTAVAASPSATATPQVRLRPCESPAVLRRGACVTEVTRYVTPAPSASSSATPYDDDRDDHDRDDDDRYDDRRDADDDDRDEREDLDEERADHHEHGEEREEHGEDHDDD